jgi:hypothetical protein
VLKALSQVLKRRAIEFLNLDIVFTPGRSSFRTRQRGPSKAETAIMRTTASARSNVLHAKIGQLIVERDF